MRYTAATLRPRARPFREEVALDVLLFGDGRLVRRMALRHVVRAVATVRRLIALRRLAEAFGAVQGDA